MTVTTRLPRAAHRWDAPSRAKPRGLVDVVLIGHTGQVGRAVLQRLETLRDAAGRPLVELGEVINRSEHGLMVSGGLAVGPRTSSALEQLVERRTAIHRPTVVVDCTADPKLPSRYVDWLSAGFGVVTPNKHGFSGDARRYARIRDAALALGTPLGYAATVGAGLPVLATLRRWRASGRAPACLTAVVSGTLVEVFNQMQAGRSLSESVAAARAAGFTEPDPLEDLSGRDVARKLRILVREAGLADPDPLAREPVVPDRWSESVRDRRDVIVALREHDQRWARRIEAARRQRQRWIYRARFEPGRVLVGPTTVPEDHAFAALEGSDNRIELEQAGGKNGRVVIEGPGAGVDVTATSVLSDLAEAAERLIERSDRASR